ncbi:MAG: DUF1343 domain-containing protein [Candidatus Krumholzibacteria bacterium]|nr:DUF1343 domain-containing protein [Candidatus Krumholzibacteria bacterium]
MTRTGLDIIAEGAGPALAGRRIGLLANQASVDSSFRHATEVLLGRGAALSCLFGPQHGPAGLTQANMIEWEGYRDPALGIPVHSLYGSTREPTAPMLEGLDAVVIDLPDVGARPYTYIWTALLTMRACAAAGIRVVVLDRPNPIGGEAVEGPVLEPGFESFVGLRPLAMRHGMTIGETLSMLRAEEGLDGPFEVVPVEGWRRNMHFDETGLHWVPPSPNIPTPRTALLYAGMVLLEGTNISEGRGTTIPFEMIGAPWIDPGGYAAALARSPVSGAAFRPAVFRPTFDKHAGEDCGGVQIHVTDRGAFRPVLCAVSAILAAAALCPGSFRWAEPPYEYETLRPPIDILYGSAGLREAAAGGRSPAEVASAWRAGERAFAGRRRPYLLYD